MGQKLPSQFQGGFVGARIVGVHQLAVDEPGSRDHPGGHLAGLGWERVPRHEQRWLTRRGVLMDVLPAGAASRSRGRVEWPESGLSMSLAGFDHVFRDSVTVSLGPELQCKVVPPPVLALLK
ncbi:MAG: hypothetical protein ABSC05_38175, partial [Candidatus Solibacter sp.]